MFFPPSVLDPPLRYEFVRLNGESLAFLPIPCLAHLFGAERNV